MLEHTDARHTAARSAVLTGFTAQNGYVDDGQQPARSWLRWQTRVTLGAASAATRQAGHGKVDGPHDPPGPDRLR